MSLSQIPKGHRFPSSIIAQAVWRYHRFNDSYRDISEDLAYRGIIVSYESIRNCCLKFSKDFKDVIKKRERKPNDKWHLDEMTIKMKGVPFILWRAVDSEGTAKLIWFECAEPFKLHTWNRESKNSYVHEQNFTNYRLFPDIFI